LGLLIASFALWGIGGDILGGAGSSVAQIGNGKVSLNEYAREFQSKFTEIQQRSGGEVTRAMVIDQGLASRWVADLIQRETFSYAAHDLNIRVTDKELREYIMAIESFQDTFGEFSKNTFESIAKYQGHTSGEFEEILRRDLERQYLVKSIVSSISVPGAVEDTLIKYLMEERTADILSIPANSIKKIPEADEETLKKFYEENSTRYMAPEYRDLRFITLSVKDFADGMIITDEEIAQAMEATSATSGGNEARNFDQILFDDKETADKAFSNLESGKSFADIIIASGLTAEDAAVSENTLQNATDSYGATAAEAIFTTEKDKYTAPVETDFGWRIFYITNISAAVNDAENKKDVIEARLRNEKALDVLYDKSELVNDELAAGASLSEIATALSLEVKVALNVDASGYNSKGDLVTDVPTDLSFLTKAFDTLMDDEPLLEELDNNDYFLLVVDNVQEVALRPFEDVRTSVVDIWKAETRSNMARDQANEILAKAQNDDSMEELASASTDISFTSVTVARNDQSGKVARGIHESIFSLDTGSAKIMPAADGNGFVVVKLLSRKLSDNSMLPAQSTQLKTLLAQEYQQRFLANYWRYLEVNLPVTINQRALNSVHEQLASREQ
ncbi:MAG: SurA N-terminal domain-containing protein, partial [Emcibacter sp.]|nr:SurA N-terminal domain-containing protein [Emcibacter sp.]